MQNIRLFYIDDLERCGISHTVISCGSPERMFAARILEPASLLVNNYRITGIAIGERCFVSEHWTNGESRFVLTSSFPEHNHMVSVTNLRFIGFPVSFKFQYGPWDLHYNPNDKLNKLPVYVWNEMGIVRGQHGLSA